MGYCDHPNCSTPVIKPLQKAHSFLCEKSERYHAWHHHPHHTKVHFSTLLVYSVIVLGLIFNAVGLPQRSKAVNSFLANYDNSTLNADSSLGSSTASNDGTPADLVSPGFGGTGQAAQVTNGKTLKYATNSNLSDSEGAISLQAKYTGSIIGDWDGVFSAPYGIAYQASTDLLYISDSGNSRIVVVKSDGVTGWRSFGSTGNGDGRLSSPKGIAVDSSGNIYVADSSNNRIQIFNNAGSSLGWIGKDTLGGTGWHAVGSGKTPTSGTGDGSFYYPYGVALDSNNKIYVADYYNNRVQVYDSDASHTMIGWIGKSSTDAGWHAIGSGKVGTSGTGDYHFYYPYGIAIDSNNKIYVADNQNNRVQVYDSNASHTMIGWIGKDNTAVSGWHAVGSGRTAGGSGTADYQFFSPYGIALDSNNKIYVTDQYGYRVQVYDNDASHTMIGWIGKDNTAVSGWHAVGSGRTAGNSGYSDYQFYYPSGVTIGQNNRIYITEAGGHRIQAYDSDASHTLLGWTGKDNTGLVGWHAVGSGKTAGSSTSTNRQLTNVGGFYYSGSSGKMYIANSASSVFGGSKIVETKWDGTDWNQYASGSIGNTPIAIYYDETSKKLFIAETGMSFTYRITVMTLDGSNTENKVIDTGSFISIGGIYYDPSSDYIYCTNPSAILKVKSDGSGMSTMGSSGTGTGQFSSAMGIIYDSSSQYFYIADSGNNRIVKTKLDGSWTGWTTYGSGPGAGTGQFSSPKGITYDSSSGYFYITDGSNYRIVKTKLEAASSNPGADWSQSGWTTYGSQGTSGTGKFGTLGAIYRDPNTGYLYVADTGNYRIVKTDMTDQNWSIYDGINPSQVLFQSNNSGSSVRLEIDPFRGRVMFYPSYDSTAINNLTYLQSAALNWSRDSWHSISASYKQSSGELSLTVDGVTTTTTVSPSWSAPSPDYGDSFYIGSVPSGGFNTFSGPIDKLKVFDTSNDLVNPTSPTTLTSKSASGGTVITPNIDNWYNHLNPYFEWNSGSDTNGVDGYYVYFGTNPAADPESTSGLINADGSAHWTESLNATVAGTLVSGSTYYLRVKVKDNFGNSTTWDPIVSTKAFKYKYENVVPTNPEYVSASPSGYSSVDDYTFLWPTGSDTGGAGLAGYKYKTGGGNYAAWSNTTTDLLVALNDAWYQEGSNIFHLKTVDNAGNESSPIQVTFYHNNSAPSAPTNLVASPESSEESPSAANNFSFSWTKPDTFSGDEADLKYYYSINETPTLTNTTEVATTSLSAGPYATRQEENTLYLVAKDEAGNINYGIYTSVSFWAVTSAPGTPTAVSAIDGSNRDLADYKVFLTWHEPTDKGAGFSGYSVYRSTDGINFSLAGTTTSTTFADTSLSSQIYYYYVKSQDNAEQYSVASSTIDIIPTGKFSYPPILKNNEVNILPKAYSAVISWDTQDADPKIVHKASSFVDYGTDLNKLGKEKGGETNGDQGKIYTDNHTVTLKGLQPGGTLYYYQAVWVDENGNESRSETLSFRTLPRPTVLMLPMSNVTLNSATISYTTSVPTTTMILYSTDKEALAAGRGKEAKVETGYVHNHTINLSKLEHTSKYYYVIRGTDADKSNLDIGSMYDFDTLTMPKIKGLVQSDQNKTAPTTTYRFLWETNIETTTIINYEGSDGQKQSRSNADYTLIHNLIIPDLADMSIYKFSITGRDKYGNEIETPFTTSIETPKDSRPPKVSNMTIEVKSSGFGTTQKAQVVVIWETDELATSQVEYEQGISGTEYKNKSKEEATLSTNHVVIISELEPSKIYHLRAVSKDAAGNAGYSDDTTTITGKIQNSILDIIMNALENSLGWLFSIFKN